MTHSVRAAVAAPRLDPGQLPIRDRAVLRIHNRAQLANAEQLGILVYRNRHYAQIHLRRLWELGYLERSGLPPPTGVGGSPYVYRLAPAAIAGLGYAPRPWRGPGYIAHTLHAVEAECALVRSTDPDTRPTVLRWLPESIVADVLPAGPAADIVVVIAADDGPATVCLEIDEGNQHLAPIGDMGRWPRTLRSAVLAAGPRRWLDRRSDRGAGSSSWAQEVPRRRPEAVVLLAANRRGCDAGHEGVHLRRRLGYLEDREAHAERQGPIPIRPERVDADLVGLGHSPLERHPVGGRPVLGEAGHCYWASSAASLARAMAISIRRRSAGPRSPRPRPAATAWSMNRSPRRGARRDLLVRAVVVRKRVHDCA